MSALNGPIVVNNSTGSDTLSSGRGPSTALNGTGAVTSASTSVDLSADSPDLSGVVAGDLLFVNTSSGRRYARIASVDNGTKIVTCSQAYTTSESGRSWAIGGKLATLDHANTRRLFDAGGSQGDAAAFDGCIVDVEETGTDYTITSFLYFHTLGSLTSGPLVLKSSSSTKPIIKYAYATVGFTALFRAFGSYLRVEHLDFTQSDFTFVDNRINYLFEIQNSSTFLTFKDVTFRVPAYSAVIGATANANDMQILIDGCLFDCPLAAGVPHTASCITSGLDGQNANLNCTVVGSTFKNVRTLISCGGGFLTVIGNVVHCYADSVSNVILRGGLVSNRQGWVIVGNTFYNAGDAGILFDEYAYRCGCIRNNVFKGSAGYDLEGTSSAVLTPHGVIDHNVGHGFSSGHSLNIAAGDGANEQTIDPQLADADNLDFTPGNLALAGDAFPQTLGAATNFAYPGAIQPEAPAGGSLLAGNTTVITRRRRYLSRR